MSMFLELCDWQKKIDGGWKVGLQAYARDESFFCSAYDSILFCGMGGSGVAGRFLQTILSKKSSTPCYSIEGIALPSFISSKSIAFVTSYSGETWEMVELFKELRARAVSIVVLAHSGELLSIALKEGIPSIEIPFSQSPRSALGIFLGAFCALLSKMTIFDGQKCINDFKDYLSEFLPLFKDKAYFSEFLSLAAGRDFFHIFGVSLDSYASAFRAQTQFNENSKVAAVVSALPEAHHNLLASFISSSFTPFILLAYSDFIPSKLKNVILCLEILLKREGVALYKVPLLGDTWEKQLFHIIVWSDFASYYLAEQRHVDCMAVTLIKALKEETAKILE